MYRDELETHVLSAEEVTRAILVLGPPSWEAATGDEIAAELWGSLKQFYVDLRSDWFPGT